MVDGIMQPVVAEAHAYRAGKEPPVDLKEACQQFEGLLVGMILKESMQSQFSEEGENGIAGLDMFRDFCVEHVATSLAETSSLGIADQLIAATQVPGIKQEEES